MTLPPSAGVIGWPVAHSKSPAIHRFWLGKLGIDGDYGRFPVAPDCLGDAVRALPALGLRGVNVTVPHKVAVMAHLDRIDPLAASVGAVNTVVVEDGALVGYNTDAEGVAAPLRAVGAARLTTVELAPLRALAGAYRSDPAPVATLVQIIGAGGAARAAVVGTAAAGYGDCAIFARSVERAEPVARMAGARLAMPLASLGPSRDDGAGGCRRHIVINATTLGMAGNDPVPIDLARYPSDTVVFDMVYAPLETPLLAAARARGLRTIDGLAMLVGQAAAAFVRFYGAAAPREHDAELRALLIR